MNNATRQVAIREAQRAYAGVLRRYGDVSELATLHSQVRRFANTAAAALVERADKTDKRLEPLFPWR